MPDRQGVLSTEERDQITKWIDDKNPDLKCPVSSDNDWILTEHLIHMPIYTTGGIIVGGTAYPQVQIVCAGCGHTLLFNAVTIGLVPAKKKEEANAKK